MMNYLLRPLLILMCFETTYRPGTYLTKQSPMLSVCVSRPPSKRSMAAMHKGWIACSAMNGR